VMSRKRKLLFAFGVLAVSLACACVVAEVLLRRFERGRTSVPETMPYLYYQHSRLRYALVRGGEYYGWAHVNAQGFRGTRDVQVEKTAGTLRVMAVGGSTTFDTTVSGDDRAWPARLEQHLAELAPDRRVEVINAGVPGYRSLDNLIRLETELHAFRPDVIILYEVHNDFYDALRQMSDPPDTAGPTPDELPTSTPWGRWLERNSLLYMKLKTAAKVLRSRGKGARGETPEQVNARVADALARGAVDFERNLSAFVAVANSQGIHVVLPEVVNVSGAGALAEEDALIRRVWEVNFPYTTPEVILGGYARYNDASRRVAARAASATHIPTAGFGLRGTEFYAPYDPIHSNDRGADLMGRRMAEALLTTGALDRAPAVSVGAAPPAPR
jgi:lysophospholipase L1-like esterase